MFQDFVNAIESGICKDRGKNSCGTASIKFQDLDFDLYCSEDDKNNIERLEEIFEKGGCFRYQAENRIPALIDKDVLESSIQLSGISKERLAGTGDPPELSLPPGYKVECLQGRSRVRAAQSCLPTSKQRWAVELLLKECQPSLQQSLIRQRHHERKYDDMIVYHNIRDSSLRGDVLAEGQWKSHFNGTKLERMQKFLKHKNLVDALDKILVMPGQRSGLTISLLDDAASMWCDDEIDCYWKGMYQVWLDFVSGDKEMLRHVCPTTVEQLETTVPGRCSKDRELLEPKMRRGELFPGIKEPTKRDEVWGNVLKTPYLIPSNNTLAKDLKVLETVARVLGVLLPLSECPKNESRTIRQRLQACFSPGRTGGRVRIQTDEMQFEEQNGAEELQRNLGVFQLPLYVFRQFSIPIQPRNKKKNVQDEEVPQAIKWHQLAVLASVLGFESPKIQELLSQSPDREIAGKMLRQARPPYLFHYDQDKFDESVARITKEFVHAQANQIDTSGPQAFQDRETEQRSRCGRPVGSEVFRQDCQHLFLDSFLQDQHQQGQYPSTLFVQICVFRAFFGELIEGWTLEYPIDRLAGAESLPLIPLAWNNPAVAVEENSNEPSNTYLRQEHESAMKELKETQDHAAAQAQKIQELENLTLRQSGLAKENKQLREQITEAEDKRREMETRLESQNLTIHDQLTRAIQWDAREANLTAMLDALRGEKTTAEAAEDEIKEVRTQRDEALADLKSTTEQNGALGMENATRQQQSLELKRQLENMQNELNCSQDKLQTASDHAQEVQQRISELEKDLGERTKSADEIARELEIKITKTCAERDEVTQALRKSESEVKELTKTIEKRFVTVVALEREKSELLTTNDKLQVQLAEQGNVLSRVEALEQQNQKLSKTIDYQKSAATKTARKMLEAESKLQEEKLQSSEKAGESAVLSEDEREIFFQQQHMDGTRTSPRKAVMSPDQLARTLQKAVRKGVQPMTTMGRCLRPESAWEQIVNDGTFTVVEAGMGSVRHREESLEPTGTKEATRRNPGREETTFGVTSSSRTRGKLLKASQMPGDRSMKGFDTNTAALKNPQK